MPSLENASTTPMAAAAATPAPIGRSPMLISLKPKLSQIQGDLRVSRSRYTLLID